MAKKEKKAEKKVEKKKKGKKGNLNYIGKQLTAADELANKLGINPDNDQLDLSREEAWADPESGAFVGRRSDEMKNYIDAAQKQVENAGKRSAEVQSTLDLMKGGLAGLNAQENQALREAASQEITRQYQGSVRKLAEAQTKGRVFGASRTAQMANLDASQRQQRSDAERDLMIKNIDIQDSRRKDYLAANRNVEGDEFDRTNKSLKDYGSAIGDAEKSEYDKMVEAQGMLQKGRDANIALKNQSKAGRLGNLLGITGYDEAVKSGKRQYNIAKGGLANQRHQTDTNAASTNNYYNTMKDIYKSTYGEEPPA